MSGFLQDKARQERPDVEELKKLANSVDEFTTSLIDPLKSDRPSREAFGNSLDSIIDKAIEYKQMKVEKLVIDCFDQSIFFERTKYNTLLQCSIP